MIVARRGSSHHYRPAPESSLRGLGRKPITSAGGTVGGAADSADEEVSNHRTEILGRPVFDGSLRVSCRVGVHPDRDGPGMVPPRPPASAVTGGLNDLVCPLSCEVPDSLGQLNSRKSKLPIRDRQLRTSGLCLGSRTVNTAARVSGARGTS
jgi:hypothetical protein